MTVTTKHKIIIAGGRKQRLSIPDIQELNRVITENFDPLLLEIVHGGCSGVDLDADAWAKTFGYKIKVFDVKDEEWAKLGKAAGPIRNRKMAKYADSVILFPGGNGTASMYREAKKEGLNIIDWRF